MRLHVPIKLRWSDLDAYGHVNNAEMLRLLEEARIEAFWATDDSDGDANGAAAGSGEAVGGSTAVLDGRPGADTLTLIARQEIEYLAPIPYLRQPLDVQLWLGRLGGASLEVCYEVWSPEGTEPKTLFSRAATTIVLVDATTQRPRRINERERDAWTPYLDEPVAFAKRS
ncbi:acyl-CoA thioester hydrolase [Leifsonia sp. 98AMF]|uniref:acyl-CoA thioesterase n=1 Tax=unclassified Leifsonia TaxID=2663824 RepID=UPI00087A55ED|nr:MULTISPECIES: thioesterase family protein [unclassified Leifsonia]SDH30328.1 acyl-CoA thioester hydrolase [Leifsonia sp. 197AMF]SDJ05677.1 acyl-CoA thioester hydrolase [Leifsonia sp. 466MF]SDJ66446.1 acyl-CoA thioester hydrolase [Leifsonia sp. 157MF]SDN26139.1 acyl-CoA thioester hydrolase [Leifsonia sp. 509MF]SEM94411.1 acyl-CoA thioester hydrolase [Leifsonia sp. 467MF]